MTSSFLPFLWSLAAYLALTVALTWPLAAGLTATVPSDLGDPVLNTWILWWNATTLPLSEAWWHAPAFFPATDVTAFSEHLLGLSVFASPVIWLGGSPHLAYNLTFLLTFPFSAAAGWLLGLELTGRRDAAFIAGLAFGFAPYRIAQLAHLQVLASFWMPVALLGLHRYLRLGERRWLALFGGAWLLQALSNGYYLAFFPVLIGLWIVWFVPPRAWRRAAAILTTVAVSSLPLVPILLRYRSVHEHYGFSRPIETIRQYSADLASPLSASPRLALWGDLQVFSRGEGQLFTGVAVLALIFAGAIVARRRRDVAAPPPGRSAFGFYAFAAAAMFVLALGPSPTLLGTRLLDGAPYAWLLHLPGVDGLRVPARFAMLMVLCLSMAAALAFARLSAGAARARRVVVAGLLSAAIVSESWMREMPLWGAHRPWDIHASEITGGLLVLPILNAMNDLASMSRAMTHGRPLVNGYSGHHPAWAEAMVDGLGRGDPAVLDELARAGVTDVAIVSRNDGEGRWRRFVLTRATEVRADPGGAFVLYRLHAPVPVRDRIHDRVVPIAAVETSINPALAPLMLDGDVTTRWQSGPQDGTEAVLVDLGAVHSVSAVELVLGRFMPDWPRELVVEVSIDRMDWLEAWRGTGAAATLAGGLRSPGTTPALVRLDDQPARFIRLRQAGRDDTYWWTIAELVVRTAAR